MATRHINIDENWVEVTGATKLALVANTDYTLECVEGTSIILRDLEAAQGTPDTVPAAPPAGEFGHVMWPGTSARVGDIRRYRALRGWYLFARSSRRVATLVVTEF